MKMYSAGKTGNSKMIMKNRTIENGKILNYMLLSNLALLMMPAPGSNFAATEAQEFNSSGQAPHSTAKNTRGSAATKQNLLSSYIPTHTKNTTFTRRLKPNTPRFESNSTIRRKSVDNSCSFRTAQSTTVYRLADKSLVYEKRNDRTTTETGSNQLDLENCESNLPPLTSFGDLSLQPELSRQKTPRERRRSLSGQYASRRNEKFVMKNQRSSSVDYPNVKMLIKSDSKSSFVSGRNSQVNGTLATSSFSSPSELVNANSARSSYSAFRRGFNAIHTHTNNVPSSTSDMLDSSRQNSLDRLAPENVFSDLAKIKQTLRASSVYSPISVASTEKLSRMKPILNQRRASLPNTSITLAQESYRSPEFFKTMYELKQESDPTTDTRVESDRRSSAAQSLRRETLQKIEEVHPESATDNEHHKQEPKDSEIQMNVKKSGNISSTPVKNTPQDFEQDSAKESVKNSTVLKKNEDSKDNSIPGCPGKKASFFHVPEKGSIGPKKVISRLESKKAISNNEQNLHFAEPENKENSYLMSLHKKSDCLDNSVIYREDDDLCDEDFHEKRMILWLMEVSTGEEAERVTRITPPPSPDLSGQESAIRVVYSGESKNG